MRKLNMTRSDVTPPGGTNVDSAQSPSVDASARALALSAVALAGLLAPVCAAAAPLTFEEAVRLAAERNERARIAVEQTIAANARVDRARSTFFPDVTAGGTYTRQPPTQNRLAHELASNATLQLMLFDARAFPLYRAALRDAQATALESEDQRRLVAFQAADAYLLTLGTQQVSEAAKRRQSLAQRSREEAEVRFRAGLASSNDVTRTTLEVATADQAATRAGGDAQNAVLQLAYVVGAPVELPLAGVEGVLPESPGNAIDAEALVRRAAEQRLDLASSVKRLEAAEASAEETLWRWVPIASVTGRYALRTIPQTSLTGLPEDWSVAFGLTWFLFDGGERFAERAERNALARIAALTRDATARQVTLDVRTALVALDVADAAVRQASVSADVARKNADETEVLYRQGLARAFEVADANVRLFEAEVALARERYARAQAWLGLRAALGQDPLGREPHR
ncbi:MAG TPA: TolC family protein [Myxococcaceae bacterium]|nr:TolC family protein [Myxococcaceae bacterium]